MRVRHLRFRSRIALVGATAAIVLPIGAVATAHAAPPSPLGYGFEDGTDGFFAPNWLSANQTAESPAGPDVSQDCALASVGSCSLAIPVDMPGGSYDQAGADVVLDNENAVDISAYESVSFDVYAPVSNLNAGLYFNNPWTPANHLTALTKGWNTVTENLTSSSTDFGGGVSSAKELLLLIVGMNAPYTGTINVDNVRFNVNPAPRVQITAPLSDATISTPNLSTPYAITADVAASGTNTITNVTWSAGTQSGTMTTAGGTSWSSPWNIWSDGDGLRTLTVTATDSSGASTSASTTFYVHDSLLAVTIVSPTFDTDLSGKVLVIGTVKPDPRYALKRVWLDMGDGPNVAINLAAADSSGARPFAVELDSHRYADGVHTMKVIAQDATFTVNGLVDVQLENHAERDGIVSAKKTAFSENGKSFDYVGWNEYELFTRQDATVQHIEATAEGEILQPGTVLTWQNQIDRQMLEAERNGLTVLRTWAFDLNTGDSYAFDPGANGNYNEQTLQKLDYIMDSAKRHHIKVILTLSNYWNDYGGIQAYATKVGLANKLQFFTSAAANGLYEAYVKFLVDRVNTVNGIAYKDDPTLFAWELMNEPRDDCADDPTAAGGATGKYCDPTGNTVKAWITNEAAFVKGLDSKHMVTAGGEGHGLVQTPNGPFQWARADEGGGNDPFYVQNVPNIDFVNFHPYPNASWAQFTFAQTKALVAGEVQMGRKTGKPVVMEEFGIDRAQPITSESGTLIQPTDRSYLSTRVTWYNAMLAQCYQNGCAGSNVWMIADWSDANLNVNIYLPAADAARDAPLMKVFDHWAQVVEHARIS
ncbi:MAG: cellulase family glycosylhydrolase [Acidothermaceae bacterium]